MINAELRNRKKFKLLAVKSNRLLPWNGAVALGGLIEKEISNLAAEQRSHLG
jgi:hypothetical protein